MAAVVCCTRPCPPMRLERFRHVSFRVLQSHSFHRGSTNANRMGYNKCSVAGCVSKPGVGKVFKQLPKNPDLAQLWLQSFPKDLRVTKSLAICEDHFDSSQFEKVRQDGKKKLKFSAVPFTSAPPVSAVPAWRPFTDITNCQILNKVTAVPTGKVGAELDAADALLAFSQQPSFSEAVENETPSVMDESFNPAFNSTIICNDQSFLGEFVSREDGSFELDKESGFFKVHWSLDKGT